MVMTDESVITATDLLLRPGAIDVPQTAASRPAGNLKEARHQWEKLYLEQLLRECGGNVSEAARRAGKYRSDLYNLLRKHGIEPQDFKA